MLMHMLLWGVAIFPAQLDLKLPSLSPPPATPRISVLKKSDIVLLDLETGEQRKLTEDDAPDFQPAFSPDGTRIAYASNHGKGYDIYVIPVDGGEPVNFTPDSPEDDFAPAWAPDGERIAFCRRVGRGTVCIFELDLASGETKRITPEDTRTFYPVYRPNSGELFVTYFEGIPGKYTAGLASISEEGVLDRFPQEHNKPFLIQARFEATGEKLAVRGNTVGSGEIYVLHLKDQRLEKLTAHTAEDRDPIFSVDGESIYFSSARDGAFKLYRQRIGDTAAEPIIAQTEGDHLEPALSPSGKTLAFVAADVLDLQEFFIAFPQTPQSVYHSARYQGGYNAALNLPGGILSISWRLQHQIGAVYLGRGGELIGAPRANDADADLALVSDGEGLAGYELADIQAASEPMLRVSASGELTLTPTEHLRRRLKHETLTYDAWPLRNEKGDPLPLSGGQAIAPRETHVDAHALKAYKIEGWAIERLRGEHLGIEFLGPPSQQSYFFCRNAQELVMYGFEAGIPSALMTIHENRSIETHVNKEHISFPIAPEMMWPFAEYKGKPLPLRTGMLLQEHFFRIQSPIILFPNGVVGSPYVSDMDLVRR